MDRNESGARLKRRRLWFILGSLFIGLPAVLVLTGYVWNAVARWQFNAHVAAIEARGAPTTPSDLAARCRLPEGVVDCTPLWQDAWAQIQGLPFDKSLPLFNGSTSLNIPPFPGEPWESLEKCEILVDNNRGALEKVRQAAVQGGAACIPIQYELGLDAPLEHLTYVRAITQLVCLDAFIGAHRGEPERVNDALCLLPHVTKAIQNERPAVSRLIKMVCDWNAMQVFAVMLPYSQLTDSQLLEIQNHWDYANSHNSFAEMVQAERVMGLCALKEPPAELPYSIPIVRWYGMSFWLTRIDKLEEASELNLHERIDAAFTMADELDRTNSAISCWAQDLPLSRVLGLISSEMRHETIRRVVVAGLAMERYRRHAGDWAPDWESIVPEFLPAVPLDPLDGQPLRLKREENTLVIYGLGPNERDDGGDCGPGRDTKDSGIRLSVLNR